MDFSAYKAAKVKMYKLIEVATTSGYPSATSSAISLKNRLIDQTPTVVVV